MTDTIDFLEEENRACDKSIKITVLAVTRGALDGDSDTRGIGRLQ